MSIGKAIKLVRTDKNMTQKELSKLAEVSPAFISLIERGKRDPNITVIEAIATGLSIPLVYLVFLAEDKEETKKVDGILAEKLAHSVLNYLKESR